MSAGALERPALWREVALELLPEAFAADPDRLARFERGALLLASLNHTGIAHLYGFESAHLPDGSSSHFPAMELESRRKGAVLHRTRPATRRGGRPTGARSSTGEATRSWRRQNPRFEELRAKVPPR